MEDREHGLGEQRPGSEAPRWQAPGFEVISLSCEITAYAPDDEPLF